MDFHCQRDQIKRYGLWINLFYCDIQAKYKNEIDILANELKQIEIQANDFF